MLKTDIEQLPMGLARLRQLTEETLLAIESRDFDMLERISLLLPETVARIEQSTDRNHGSTRAIVLEAQRAKMMAEELLYVEMERISDSLRKITAVKRIVPQKPSSTLLAGKRLDQSR